MRFSIIVPVYNVEAYVEECLCSIRNQTCTDWELILIDDGSTDKSGDICDAFARQHPERIRVFHQENQGVLKTRVTGLNQATGEICVFVDSDDAIRLDALEKIKDAFDKMHCDMVMYGASGDAEFISELWMLPLENGHCFEGNGKKDLYKLAVETGKINTLAGKAVKKVVYDEVLREYDSSLDVAYGEDLHLTMPLLTKAEKIVFLAEKLYFYRPREGSISNSFIPSFHRHIKTVRMEMEKYIALWDIPECYPALYTTVTRYWVRALKSLLKYQKTMDESEALTILHELGEDEFFRKAYENMEPGRLSKRDALLARWLYQKKYTALRILGSSFYSLKGGWF